MYLKLRDQKLKTILYIYRLLYQEPPLANFKLAKLQKKV